MMKEGNIERVEYGQIDRDGGPGLRISFFMDCDEDTEHADIFEFFDNEDVQHLVALIGMHIAPTFLMCDIRKRLNITVH